jgi:predicted metal-dependent hydrolase
VRRIILRIDQDTDGVVLTMPKWARQSDAMALLAERADWVLARIDALPARIRFADGAAVPYFDAPHTIRHAPGGRGVVLEGGEIRVPGRAEHLARRLGDWLRAQARREISARAHLLAGRVGKPIRRITVRDTRSRWGSCSSAGNLSFSWRLVMAPDWVMEYVVAHEVAHLRHANHGPDFWAAVERLGVGADAAQRWLNGNAARLQRIG